MPLSRKLATLIFKNKTTVEEVTDLLTKYKMLALLPLVRKSLVQMSLFANKNDTMMIESPFPLSDIAIKRVKRIVGNDLAEYEVILNKEILAGFRVKYKGVVYDGSAERIIKQLLAK
jgi:F0F1-type ATP synthase delta subunit